MRRGPRRPVGFDVDQVPGGKREAVEILERPARVRSLHARFVGEDETLDALRRIAACRPVGDDIEDADLAFAENNGVGSGREI